MLPAKFLVCFLALLGHLAFWVAVHNRLHAIGWHRRLVKATKNTAMLILLGPLAMFVGWTASSGDLFADPLAILGQGAWIQAYFWLCFGTAVPVIVSWCWRGYTSNSAYLVSCKRRTVHAGRQLGFLPCGDLATRLLVGLPGNQALQLEVNEKVVAVPRLSGALDGLTIAHLSDLHFTGRLSREFFEFVVEQTNELEPDLVAITGDIIDKEKCLPWIGDVLGRLRAKSGVFYVFGNHERRIPDASLLASTFEDAGLTHLGGRWTEVRMRGRTIILAGNELPWFRPAADMTSCPKMLHERRLPRVLLSHSPDQIQWARAHDFDLMLAGHMHGGQIRFPLIGPVVGPSFYGVRYSGGVYYVKPTLLHVSRGVAGVQTLRIHCRPELTKLVLRPLGVEATTDELRATDIRTAGLPVPARLCRTGEDNV